MRIPMQRGVTSIFTYMYMYMYTKSIHMYVTPHSCSRVIVKE